MKVVFSIFIGILMLASNAGITVATHFCQGKAVKSSVTIGHADLTCGMVQADTPCEHQSDKAMLKGKKCCENKFVQPSLEDDYQSPATLNVKTNIQFAAAFTAAYLNLYSFIGTKEVSHSEYSPPLLDIDIPVLIQSFLI